MKIKKFILNLLMIIFFCIFIFSAFMLIKYFYDAYSSEKKNDNIIDIYQKEVSEENRYKKLLEINTEAVGFLEIKHIDIAYPVVQSEDNEKYLHTDFNLEKNKNGAVFADYRIDIEKDRKIIIYAHNMKSGNMFAKLLKLEDKTVFESCKDIEFNIKGDMTKWEIFAAFYAKSSNSDLYSLNISSDEEFLKEIKKNQGNFKDINIENKRILMLSTCSYKDKDRFVVLAAQK